jgi:hypothetical protein
MSQLRRHALLLSTAGLVACGGPAIGVATSVSPTSGGVSGTVQPARLWVQQGSESALGTIAVLNTAAHSPATTLPPGVFDRAWDRLYSVGRASAGMSLSTIDPTTGRTVDSTTVPSGFGLPDFGPSQRLTGLSPNGAFLVLARGVQTADIQLAKSSFLVYDTAAITQAPRRVELAGSFHFDGLSNDGHNLFLLEDLGLSTAGGGYHVRRYDLVAGALDPQVIADKRTGERTMSGSPTDQVTSHDGAWQFTVYAFGASSPFVHVLDLNDSVSFCIDLPNAPTDQALDLLWGLAASHDGRFVYAVNAANGAVVEMPVDAAFQTRSGSLPVPSAAPAAWAPWAPLSVSAKRITYGAATISLDDRTLYSLGDTGVAIIDVATFHLRGTLLDTTPLISLTLSPDGEHLYAAPADTGRPLLQIDTRNGSWTSIVGTIQPLAVLHAGT